MGDMVYPGIQLWNITTGITAHDVDVAIRSLIGDNPVLYAGGTPRIKILSGKDVQKTVNVLVYGILLPFNDIRRKLSMQWIRSQTKPSADSLIQIRDVDFGLSRQSNGQVEPRFYQLHQHLSRGQGYGMPSMHLLNPEFAKPQLGGWTTPSNKITFNQNLSLAATGMLSEPGECLYFWKNRGTLTDIHYVYAMEALQAMLYLNLNPTFCNPPQYFINKSNCLYRSNDFLGVGGVKLDIGGTLAEFGYIPMNMIDPKVIDPARLERYFNDDTGAAINCVICKTAFTISGYGPDLTWFAVKCKCLITNAMTTWKDEQFFRMIPNSKFKNAWGKYQTISDGIEKVIQFIKGQTPLFDDVEDYSRSGHAAAMAEYKFNKRELSDRHRQLGYVLSADFIEKDEENEDKPIYLYKIKIIMPRTSVWCIERQGSVDRITMILPEYEKQTHKWIKGKVYAITDTPDVDGSPFVYDVDEFRLSDDQICVTAVVETDEERGIHVTSWYMVVPKPPKTEVQALRSLLSKWRHFEKTRKNQMLNGKIISALYCKDVDFSSYEHRESMWILNVILDTSRGFDFHDENTNSQYEGAEVYLPVNENATGKASVLKVTGRILAIYNINGELTLKIAIILESKWDVLEHYDLQLRIWVLVKKDRNVDVEIMKQNTTIVETFYVTWLPNLTFKTEADIVTNWLEKPDAEELFHLDFLLRRKERFMLLPTEPLHVSSSIVNQATIEKIDRVLNDSQRLVVNNFIKRVLSVAVGPPGTGKTKTCSLGILKLALEEDGTIVACCPSNFAANVLYERIKSACELFNVKIKVVRMLGETREEMDMRANQELDMKDPNLLHVQVLKHEEYNNVEMVDLITKADKYGRASLTKLERKDLKDHKLRIGRQILLESRVVICTVGCASDNRLNSLNEALKRSGKGISALVLDECSLLTVPSILPVLTLSPKRMWLLGDPNQLPPILKNESSINACLDVSWMEFLPLTPYFQDLGSSVHYILDTQYRMAEEIASVVSNTFYDKVIKSPKEVGERQYPSMLKYRRMREIMPELKDHNIGLYTYSGFHEERNPNSGSQWNSKECEIVVDLVKKLAAGLVPMKDVVIIAMYDYQVKKIKERITTLGEFFQDVTVATVDSFQGKESPVVIVSTVRSNAEHNLGFLKEIRRTVVAVSRAIDYLLLVTDKSTLVGSSVYGFVQLFKNIDEKRVVAVQC